MKIGIAIFPNVDAPAPGRLGSDDRGPWLGVAVVRRALASAGRAGPG